MMAAVVSCTESTEKVVQEEVKKTNQVVNGKREGLHVQKNDDGSIRNEIHYKNGLEHGLSTDYYQTGEKRMDLTYVEGVKNGDAVWYHKNGKIFRVNPYVDGYVTGVQKKYYENGQQMSEVEFRKDLPAIGLKEWDRTGGEKKFGTKIKAVRKGSKVQVQLARLKQSASFYLGELDEGKFMSIDLKDITLGGGVGEFDMSEFKGKSSIDVIVKYPSYNKNPLVFVATIKKSQL